MCVSECVSEERATEQDAKSIRKEGTYGFSQRRKEEEVVKRCQLEEGKRAEKMETKVINSFPPISL